MVLSVSWTQYQDSTWPALYMHTHNCIIIVYVYTFADLYYAVVPIAHQCLISYIGTVSGQNDFIQSTIIYQVTYLCIRICRQLGTIFIIMVAIIPITYEDLRILSPSVCRVCCA